MPNLPGLTLSQPHFDRVLAAFPGSTPAQKAEAYEVWLTNHLIDFVEREERNAIIAANRAAVEQQLKAVSSSLPARRPWPPPVS